MPTSSAVAQNRIINLTVQPQLPAPAPATYRRWELEVAPGEFMERGPRQRVLAGYGSPN